MTTGTYNSAKSNRDQKALLDTINAAMPVSFGIETEVEVTASDTKNMLDLWQTTFCPDGTWLDERYHTDLRTAIEAFYTSISASISSEIGSLDTAFTSL
jgi:hypothetical protein